MQFSITNYVFLLEILNWLRYTSMVLWIRTILEPDRHLWACWASCYRSHIVWHGPCPIPWKRPGVQTSSMSHRALGIVSFFRLWLLRSNEKHPRWPLSDSPGRDHFETRPSVSWNVISMRIKDTEYKLEPSDLWNDWWFHPAMII